ncbi:MAG: flagellar hook-basal body complex protein, partial [Leptothrix sp. (in: b-proteobacteria)]
TNGSAPTAPAAPLVVDIPATAAADGSTTEAITGVSLDFTKATQYGALFSVTDLNQNGYAPGQMTSLNIESNGIITARYSNGLTKSAGQIEVASFRNPQGLQAMGGNTWAATYASGTPTVGTPQSGNMGSLQSGALEESNVDLTAELVNMITAQRVYQANAQTIKTQDSVLQTLVSLR